MSILSLMMFPVLAAADGNDGLAAKMLPIYQREAAGYTIAVESEPRKPLELKKEPVFEWSNPGRDGLAVQGVVFLWLRDGRPAVVGTIFSNVMMAVSKPLFDAKVITISPNAGPSPLAGKGCSPWFFSTAWQNDQNHEAMGKHAQDKGYKKVVLIADRPAKS